MFFLLFIIILTSHLNFLLFDMSSDRTLSLFTCGVWASLTRYKIILFSFKRGLRPNDDDSLWDIEKEIDYETVDLKETLSYSRILKGFEVGRTTRVMTY